MACGGAPATAVNIVESRFNTWNTFATTAFNDAETRLDTLAEFDLSFSGIAPSFSVNETLGSPFTYQDPPSLPDLSVDYSAFNEPDFPTLPEIAPPSFKNAPENTATKPSLSYPPYPTLDDPTLNASYPTLQTISLPTAPDADALLPTAPTLTDITLPTAPTITLPTFSGTAPTEQPKEPLDTFTFTEDDYDSDMLGGDLYTTIEAKVEEWMAGTQVIPTTIWNAIWDRSRAQQNKAYLEAKEEATIRWSSRGFTAFPGMLNSDLQKLNQDKYNQSSETSREIAIKNAEYVREDIRLAIQQGVALENLTINLFNSRMQRAFEAAKYSFQAGIDIFNAKITLYNAQYEAYRIEAQVYKTQIEAEIAKLEKYRIELDAQRLVNELNETEVKLYNAQLNSVLQRIEIYKGELAGVDAQVRIDQAAVQRYIAEIEAYAKQLEADQIKVRLFKEEMDAQKVKSEVYQTEINAFAAEIKAYQAETDLEGTRKEIELKWQDAELQRYVAKLERYKTQITAEIERLKANVGIYDGKARIYATEIGQEEARVRADAEQYRLAIEEGRADAQLQLESARTNLEQYIRTLQMELSRLDTLAKSQVGLAEAALSALNVSASTSATATDYFKYECS